MAFRLVNSGVLDRSVATPRLGARPRLAAAMDVLSVTPDSVPPEKVPPSPVSDEEATAARKTYALVAGTLQGEVEWLNKIRPANWDETAVEVITYSKTQYDSLVQQVRGRTGNPDAEYELELQWWGLWDRAFQAYKNTPSWLAQAADKVSVFLSDFVKGAQQAWQGYSEWAIRHSGPVLEKYYDCLKHLAELKADFDTASTSGDYSTGRLIDQQAAITRAEDAIQRVRTVYKAMSAGGDIDKIAIDVYGPISLGAVQIGAILAIKIAIVAAVVIACAIVVLSIGKISGSIVEATKAVANAVKDMAEKNPTGLLFTLGAIGAMMVLPFVLFRGETKVVVPRPEPEVA
jgi:hypothetical protein